MSVDPQLYSVALALAANEHDPGRWPPALFLNLVADLEDMASHGDDQALADFVGRLTELFERALRSSGDAVRRVVTTQDGGTDATQAFRLGQLCLAQAFASSLREHRAGDAFADALRQSSYADYFELLEARERSNSELAEASGEKKETVSRKLSVLRELGIVDFYRDGQKTINFLTPAAHAALSHLSQAERQFKAGIDAQSPGALERQPSKEDREVVDTFLEKFRKKLEPHNRSMPTFGTDAEKAHV